MRPIRKFFRDLLTGINGKTYDLGRVSWLWTQLAILAAATANWWHGATIPLLELGGALGANTALHGAAIGFKASTEPQPPQEPDVTVPNS